MVQRFGYFAVERKLLSQHQCEHAAMRAKIESIRMGQYCIREKLLTEEQVFDILCEQLSLPFLPEIERLINRERLSDLPLELCTSGRCLPVQGDDIHLRIAVKDPLDLDIVCEASTLSGLPVETCVTLPSELDRVCKELFKGEALFRESAGKISREYEVQIQKDETQLSLEEIKRRTEAEPVVKMVTLLFGQAIAQRASDIHIEPSEFNAIIRFRIDGMLKQFMELPRGMYSPLTSRIKILAELDIAEKRIPQDGRARYIEKDHAYDFRISTLPTHHGEKTVIRILKHDQSLLDLQNLGIESEDLSTIHELIEKPQGIIFVTGPTGSGKSSTLFACLNKIKGKEVNITTIENPIEYKLDGVNQVQINEKAGMTFAKTLRSILRQDPDIILVGEIRDRETAEIAIQASQTGHLVFSTLHTNDAVSAITRLRDLGIAGFLIASSLLSILAQRLVRILCPYCKEERRIPELLAKRWQKSIGDIHFDTAFFPVGCEKCQNIGFLGRKGIFELFNVNDEIRAMIIDNSSETHIRTYLRKSGMHSMINNGIVKIRHGITTPEEGLRVVLIDDVIDKPEAY